MKSRVLLKFVIFTYFHFYLWKFLYNKKGEINIAVFDPEEFSPFERYIWQLDFPSITPKNQIAKTVTL
jgi:hypothetical protein